MNSSALRTIDEVQQLTQEYASYSQSKNGLGNVLGGVVGLAIYLVNGLIGPGLLTALLTIGLTLTWLVGKEFIRRRFYRVFGEAQEVWTPQARRWHTGSIAFTALICVGVGVAFIWLGGLREPSGWLYLLFCAVMPWIAWRYLRTPNEFTVGIFLLCACAVTSAGGAYGLLYGSWAAFFSVLMLLKGIDEHRKFRALAIRLQAQWMVQES
ncbi:MAG: hypothetical protein IMW89_03185 [Ktedonobacteraceae bacterium]|nr:hypothetical protein [Ktedonobacteraceae bacterium]